MNNQFGCYVGNPSNLLGVANNNANINNSNASNCTNSNLLDSLCNCIGRRCTCEFEINNRLESKCGILESIGNDYLLLRSINNNRLLYCYTCNLRFVTIM